VQAGKISRAERGRFLDLRTVDRAPDQVGESLHRPIRPGQPPSTRKVFSALSACGQSDCMAARRSAVWKQTLSSAACASGPAARVRPNRAPRTSAASRAHPGRRRPERGLPPRCSATARRACWRENTGRAEVRSWCCGLNSYTSGPAARSTIAPSAGARCAFMRLYCWALGRCILQKPNLKAFPFG
jgi:hypothetical protein